MKTKILTTFIFIATVTTVLLYPQAKSTPRVDPQPRVNIVAPVTKPKIEVVFVLDTTSSMSGMIQAAKDKIWSIASTMAQADPAPEIHMGLVAFRDKGDRYVTKTVDLSEDLDQVYSTLMDFTAEGGGDGPESVNQALYEAVHDISWSQDPNSYQVIFLVGDAPPHMDYQDDVKYPVTLASAAKKGIVVNTIRCGSNHETQMVWTQMAALSQGQFFDVDQDGSAVAMATPFDKQLAELSAKLDSTRLFFGDAATKKSMDAKVAAGDKLRSAAPASVQARRAEFNLSESGRRNLLGESDLIAALEEDADVLTEIPEAHLPSALQQAPKEEREQLVKDLAKERQDIMSEMESLSRQRSAYIEEELKDQEVEDSLDNLLYNTIQKQAAEKGIAYDAGPAY